MGTNVRLRAGSTVHIYDFTKIEHRSGSSRALHWDQCPSICLWTDHWQPPTHFQSCSPLVYRHLPRALFGTVASITCPWV